MLFLSSAKPAITATIRTVKPLGTDDWEGSNRVQYIIVYPSIS
jgi:hypothetical protein